MEEWQRFCNNPENLDLLTANIVNRTALDTILYYSFRFNKSNTHFFNTCKRLLELGVIFTINNARDHGYFLALENCFEILELIGIKPCPDMYYFACRRHGNLMMSDYFFVKVLDRCYFPTSDIVLPLYARTFLISKEWAQLGAFATLHALKKTIGKDASRIIARVVWSERRNYFTSNRPNKK